MAIKTRSGSDSAKTNSLLFTDDFGGKEIEIRLCADCAEMATDSVDFKKVKILPDPDNLHRSCVHVRGRT